MKIQKNVKKTIFRVVFLQPLVYNSKCKGERKMYSLDKTTMIIYKITNIINQKSYIGQTIRTFNQRYDAKGEGVERVYKYHDKLKELGRHYNEHLHRAIERYGANNFKVEIIEVCKTREELNEREEYYIHLYNSSNSNFGYNKTKGGDGVRHTKEIIRKKKETRRNTKINALTDIYNKSGIEQVNLVLNRKEYSKLKTHQKKIILVLLCYETLGVNIIASSFLKKFLKINQYKRFYEQIDKLNKGELVKIHKIDESGELAFKINAVSLKDGDYTITLQTKFLIEMLASVEVNTTYFGKKVIIKKCLQCGRKAVYSTNNNKKYCDCCPRTVKRERIAKERNSLYYSDPKEYIASMLKSA